jgi:chromosome segregation ATPase
VADVEQQLAAAQSECSECRTRVAEAGQRLADAEQRLAEAKQRLAEVEHDWRGRVDELQNVLTPLRERAQKADHYEALLNRLGVKRAARLIPLSGRRFLVERLLGSVRR